MIRMRYKFNFLTVRIERGVAFVTINNPPINILTTELLAEFNRLAIKVKKDEDVNVIVFDSADPDFFIAHLDVNLIKMASDAPFTEADSLQGINVVFEAFRTMPKISIAKIEGICRGGGSEFVLALDMRFGAIGKAQLSQPEISIGLVVGGGSSQRLPRMIGRSRAMEVILSGLDFSAELAEKYGFINRALPLNQLSSFVDDLAYRIASYPKRSLALAKQAVNSSLELPLVEGIINEYNLSMKSLTFPATKARTNLFLDEGGQCREMELKFDKTYDELFEKFKDDETYFK